MPELTFYTDSIFNKTDTDELLIGRWRFGLTRRKPVYDDTGWNLIGYEETYANSEASQEEISTIMQQYLEETGQCK